MAPTVKTDSFITVNIHRGMEESESFASHGITNLTVSIQDCDWEDQVRQVRHESYTVVITPSEIRVDKGFEGRSATVLHLPRRGNG